MANRENSTVESHEKLFHLGICQCGHVCAMACGPVYRVCQVWDPHYEPTFLYPLTKNRAGEISSGSIILERTEEEVEQQQQQQQGKSGRRHYMMEETGEVSVLRYARGRRPFLFKKEIRINENGEEVRVVAGAAGNGKSSDGNAEEISWWTEKTERVKDWLRCNPLHLGMNDDSVDLVKKMLFQGSKKGATLEKQKKCWAHICIEMADVPGTPLNSDEVDQSNDELAEYERSMMPGAAGLPETSEEEPKASPEVDKAKQLGGTNNNNNNGSESRESLGIPHEKLPRAKVMESKESKKRNQASSRAKLGPIKSNVSKNTLRGTRRKTDSDLLQKHTKEGSGSQAQATGNAVLTRKKSLTSMSMIERQEYTLNLRKEKALRHRAMQEEKEIEACTYKPETFTRRSSFSNVDSIVKKQKNAKWGESPLTSPYKFERFGFGPKAPEKSSTTLSIPSESKQSEQRNDAKSPRKSVLSRIVSNSSIKESKPSFLDECKNLMNAKKEGSHKEFPVEESKSSVVKPAKSSLNSDKQALPRQRTNPTLTKRKSFYKELESKAGTSHLLDACKQALDESREKLEEKTESMLTEVVVDEPAPPTPKEPSPKEAPLKYRFAGNSTDQKGKIELQDYTEFQLNTYYRKRDRGSAKPGVSLLMGTREDDLTEQVVSVIFDRSKFDEKQACEWMERNVHRFPTGKRQLHKTR